MCARWVIKVCVALFFWWLMVVTVRSDPQSAAFVLSKLFFGFARGLFTRRPGYRSWGVMGIYEKNRLSVRANEG